MADIPPAILDVPVAVARDFAADPRADAAFPASTLSATAQRCANDKHDEIVVCAPDPQRYRLPPLDDRWTERTPGEVGLAKNLSVAARLDSATLAGGVTSPRVMVDLKLKF